jgi:hypothetical protein
MFARLRTFRLFAALLAATMLFGSTLPLVQHAWAMALQAHGDMGGLDHEMPSGHHHAAMQHHAAPASSDESLPCHNADDAEPHPATMGSCCFLKAAAQASTMASLLHSAEVATTPPLPVQPFVLPDPEAHQPTDFWFDTGPSRARSIALHLLHAAFLI